MLLSITTKSALGDKLFQALSIFRLLWQARFGYIASIQQIADMENQASNQYHLLVGMTDAGQYQLSAIQQHWLNYMMKRLDNLQVFLNFRSRQLMNVQKIIAEAKSLDKLPVELTEITDNTFLRNELREKRRRMIFID